MGKIRNHILTGLLIVVAGFSACKQTSTPEVKPVQAGKIWSVEKANQWYAKQRWMVGGNFIPSTAINQLEMWQAETFDPNTIDRELGYAEGIGFNTMRVYLHSMAYGVDPRGFKSRVDQYLTIADKHGIKTIFVFFDDCWNANPKPGVQPLPKTGVHNSGWAQDPGVREVKDPKQFDQLEGYFKDVMGEFKHDERVIMWDLYNEPGNSTKRDTSLALLTKVFTWARDINPDQPISVGLWAWDFEKLNAFQVLNSDIITYHQYEDEKTHERILESLKTHRRPLICTEYMARTRNSTFQTILPLLKRENVGAINWGLVAGKTNTIYAWDTPMPQGGEPELWFHDIFYKDGRPYKPEETAFIKRIISQPKSETLK